MTLRHKETCFDEDRPAVVPFGFDKSKAMYDDAVPNRADRLLNTYIGDAAKVYEGVEGLLTLGNGDMVERALRDFFMDWHKADNEETHIEAAREMYDRLWPTIEQNFRDEVRELRLAVDGECEG